MSLVGIFLRLAQRDLLIHSAALHGKYSPALSKCVARSFSLSEIGRGDVGEVEEEDEEEEARKYCETTKSYLAPQTNNVGVSAMLETLPELIPKDNDLDTPLCQAK